jgi:hypothetical protein
LPLLLLLLSPLLLLLLLLRIHPRRDRDRAAEGVGERHHRSVGIRRVLSELLLLSEWLLEGLRLRRDPLIAALVSPRKTGSEAAPRELLRRRKELLNR